jgi:hypothetical protein
MYFVCIDMKLDVIVWLGTCYELDGLGFDPSGCKRLSSPYLSRPTHLVSLQLVLGLSPGCGVDRICYLYSAVRLHGIPLLSVGRF